MFLLFAANRSKRCKQGFRHVNSGFSLWIHFGAAGSAIVQVIVSSAWFCGKLILMFGLKSGDIFWAHEAILGQCFLTSHSLSVQGELLLTFYRFPKLSLFFCWGGGGGSSQISCGLGELQLRQLRYGGL